MKSIKFAVPVLVLLAFAAFLSGCPGKDKMMTNDGMQKETMMEKQ